MSGYRYLLVVPDGVGIRNFFCTPMVERLLETGSVCVWHALPDLSVAPFRERWGDRVRWAVLPPAHDGLVERLFRQSKIMAQLYWQMKKGPDVQLRRRRPPAAWKTRLLYHAARSLAWCSAGPRRIVWLDRMHMRMAGAHLGAFLAFLRETRPDMVFCTHQRALAAVQPMLAARKLGIPSAVFIYSWDNLPKGRMAVYADTYIVWSDHMKRELLGYYPDVSPERVRVVGTPQFENYFRDSLRRPREEFFRSLGLDPGRPLVCFSGNDITSPFDPDFLGDLADAMSGVPQDERPQVLLRRSPVDTTGRYDEVLRRHPEIAVSDPLWQVVKEGEWSQLVPTEEDGALLVNVVYHSDLVVNVGSTMGMDFAVFDKPAIYIDYTPPGKEEVWNIHDVYRLPHFAPVHTLQPVYWATSRDGLGECVMHALRAPGEKREARREWLDLIVQPPLESASARFAAELQRIARNGRPGGGAQ